MLFFYKIRFDMTYCIQRENDNAGPIFIKTPSYWYKGFHYKSETVASIEFMIGIFIPVRPCLFSE